MSNDLPWIKSFDSGMALLSVNLRPSRRELRQFAALWFPAFWLIAGVLLWKSTGNLTVVAMVWSLAAFVSIIGFFVPRWMRFVWLAWMGAAFPIGWLVAHVMLATIYYGVVTPIGLILRMRGHDPIQRDIDRSRDTYWRPRSADDDVARYFRQY
jgi:hypothetical protein